MSDVLNPSAYGVLATGFTRMRMPEIRLAIINSLQTNTGVTFETRPDSITGQFIDTFAEREATVWELCEAVYHAMYPISATGVNLDHAVSFAGVRRLFAEQSSAWCVLYGAEGTTVPAGSVVRNQNTQDNFLLDAPTLITRQAAIDSTVTIMNAIQGQEYWIRVNNILYMYTAQAGDAAVDIASQLYNLLLPSGYSLSLDASNIRIYSIEAVSYVLQLSTNIGLTTVGSIGLFTAETFGPADVSVNSINQIISTFTGWNSVNNIVPGAFGRNQETDDELRLRYNLGVFRLGAATLESINANLLQNVPGILNLTVYENDSDVTDSDGRPPHSIEVIVNGGDPQQIANQIFLVKAAGIDTYGNVSVTVTDSAGFPHPINFNRPTPIYIWVNVDVFLYSEEAFSDAGTDQIKQIIADTGNAFGIGKDVIVQRLFGPIYASVTGIGKMDITVASETDPTTVPPTANYSANNIAIDARELSQFNITHIAVSIEPNPIP